MRQRCSHRPAFSLPVGRLEDGQHLRRDSRRDSRARRSRSSRSACRSSVHGARGAGGPENAAAARRSASCRPRRNAGSSSRPRPRSSNAYGTERCTKMCMKNLPSGTSQSRTLCEQSRVVAHVLEHLDRDDAIEAPRGREGVHVAGDHFDVVEAAAQCLPRDVLALRRLSSTRRRSMRAESAAPSTASANPSRSRARGSAGRRRAARVARCARAPRARRPRGPSRLRGQ